MGGAISPIEWWFVRRGMPHAIPGYSARHDVWTRAWPFLLFVIFVETFSSFGDRFEGWAQAAVFVAGVGVVVGAFAVVNVVRRRRWSRLPDEIGVWELAVFVGVPPLLTWWFTDRGWQGAASMTSVNLVILAVSYAVTSYGLLPALRVGFVQAVRQVRTVTQLVARGLPLLLLITVFVFLNAEMWQVAHDFPPAYFAACVGVLLLLAFAFLVLRVPTEVAGLATFADWEECIVLAGATDAPLASATPEADRSVLPPAPPAPDIGRVESVNIGLLLTISQAVQTLLVGATAGLFYVLFGALAVRRDTILQWTTADDIDPLVAVGVLGDEVVVTWEHLAVAGFVAAFSVLQFAVASVTDDAYRSEFHDDVALDVRKVLAVRALVHAERGSDQ
ncbi:MAG: hypothetical protein RLZZ01_1699 [Actinomycetota bacterium]